MQPKNLVPYYIISSHIKLHRFTGRMVPNASVSYSAWWNYGRRCWIWPLWVSVKKSWTLRKWSGIGSCCVVVILLHNLLIFFGCFCHCWCFSRSCSCFEMNEKWINYHQISIFFILHIVFLNLRKFDFHSLTIHRLQLTIHSFSKDKESLNRMREAEIKHCRLAMLGKKIHGYHLRFVYQRNLISVLLFTSLQLLISVIAFVFYPRISLLSYEFIISFHRILFLFPGYISHYQQPFSFTPLFFL